MKGGKATVFPTLVADRLVVFGVEKRGLERSTCVVALFSHSVWSVEFYFVAKPRSRRVVRVSLGAGSNLCISPVVFLRGAQLVEFFCPISPQLFEYFFLLFCLFWNGGGRRDGSAQVRWAGDLVR